MSPLAVLAAKFSFCVALILSISGAHGATLYVPDHHATIQGAIAAATGGDTIVVRQGTYAETIDFLGKAIALRSENGPAITVIDGGGLNSVVLFANGEGRDSILDGFTITNGYSLRGGGIDCDGSMIPASPTIINNIVTGNVASDSGGGLHFQGGYTIVCNNRISGNQALVYGGGIFCRGDAPTIVENRIDGNRSYCGGGICCLATHALIRSNSIELNYGEFGGGVYDEGQYPATIYDNSFFENDAWDSGGGVYSRVVLPAPILRNRFVRNHARKGGGICSFGGFAVISDNLVVENFGTHQGGGIYCTEGSPVIVNNTICKNEANEGGGIGCSSYAYPTITSSIIRENPTSNPPEISVDLSSFPVVGFCNVKGGWAGTGNIDADPLFHDFPNDDFHLTWQSPCRDAGDTASVQGGEDFEGDDRVGNGRVDMGADEFCVRLYAVGDVNPGSTVGFRIVGTPGLPVLLALGYGIQDPPIPTPHGDLRLTWPFAKTWSLASIPSTGIGSHQAAVPPSWPPGTQCPFQSLVGTWGGSDSRLTNLLELTVE